MGKNRVFLPIRLGETPIPEVELEPTGITDERVEGLGQPTVKIIVIFSWGYRIRLKLPSTSQAPSMEDDSKSISRTNSLVRL
jgi:hypothetical protein